MKPNMMITVTDKDVIFQGISVKANFLKIYMENEHLYVCGSNNRYNLLNTVFVPLPKTMVSDFFMLANMGFVQDFFRGIKRNVFHFHEMALPGCFESDEVITSSDLTDDVNEQENMVEAHDILLRYSEATSPEYLSKEGKGTDMTGIIFSHVSPEGNITRFHTVPLNVYISVFAPYLGIAQEEPFLCNGKTMSGIPIRKFLDFIRKFCELQSYLEVLNKELCIAFSDFAGDIEKILPLLNSGYIYIDKEFLG